jgi:hypothetical protein
MDIQEDNLLFKFKGNWSCVLKYDVRDDKGRPELAEYRKLHDATTGAKAVDFIGILEQKNLILIEVKDFRQHEIENSDRVVTGQLATEVATKVRDTIAAIVGANRISTTKESDCFKNYFSLLGNLKKEIYIVLWCEGEFSNQFKFANYNGVKLLKEKLSWLTNKVFILNRADNKLEEYLTADYLKQ